MISRNIIFMLDLIDELNKAASLYYNTGTSFLTDAEYDAKLNKLQEWETSTGIVLSNSPSNKVGAEVLDSIPKIGLGDRPMLSLDKVHSEEEVKTFAGNQKIVGSYKLDGLSVRLCYQNGKLAWAATRGNGTIGSNITAHAPHFQNIPLTIPVKQDYIIDGEAIITRTDFAKINSDNKYKNPRNLAAGTLSLLDVNEVKKRHLRFIGWDIIQGDDNNSYTKKIKRAETYGFEMVCPFSSEVSNATIMDIANGQGFPCDGVVWRYDDVAYGDSLGATSHHFNNGIAWKPKDETAWTKLLNIEYTMGRTGVLTPVAIFEPVELEGTEIERANLHNLSVMEELLGKPYYNQEIEIFKANLIIPQVKSAVKLTGRREEGLKLIFNIPTICPICGSPLKQITEVDSTVLKCEAADCPGKLLNHIDHFCSKKGLDIKGLSKATLEKLIDWGWLDEFADLYHLYEHRSEWIAKPGFGVRSVDKILEAVERSRCPMLVNFISAIGIPQVGTSLSKDLVKYFSSYDEFRAAIKNNWDFSEIDGIGPEKANAIKTFDYTEADKVYKEFVGITTATPMKLEQSLEGLVVVITGRLTEFKNRDEFINLITQNGGKVASAVSRNTTILVNNDIESNSSKNREAKKLGIPILTEKKFLEKYLTL